MRPAIRPGLGVFRRGPEHLQLGAAPGAGVILGDRPGLLELLRLLDGVRDVATVACLARERIPALADPPEALLTALEREGVVVDAAAWDLVDTALHTEARALAAAGVPPDDARDRLTARTRACVELRCDSAAEPFGAAVTDQLTDAGIATARPGNDETTVAVVVTRGPAARTLFAALLRGRTPHLVVCIDGPVVHLGPFVVPRITPCVGCADLRRTEWDAAWPAIIPQLGTPLAPVDAAPNALAAATRAVAAAVVTEEVATFCDELDPLTGHRLLALGPGVHDRTETTLDFHPGCTCRS